MLGNTIKQQVRLCVLRSFIMSTAGFDINTPSERHFCLFPDHDKNQLPSISQSFTNKKIKNNWYIFIQYVAYIKNKMNGGDILPRYSEKLHSWHSKSILQRMGLQYPFA